VKEPKGMQGSDSIEVGYQLKKTKIVLKAFLKGKFI
jgi:hypothetical protein